MAQTIFHALVLNLHQPAGNLEELLSKPNPKGEDGWEGKEILMALERIPRLLWPYEDHAKVHLAISGVLFETLANPSFQERVYGIVKCGDLLWHLQNRKIFEILATGYYHPVLPLIPEADRPEHIRRWVGIASHLLWRQSFQGFWPPEMGFAMEMIPMLRSFGFRYVLVDSLHLEPVTPMEWHELVYRPHVARYGDAEIIVIPRDRELSNAQEAGMELDWFQREVGARTKHAQTPPLVTTCTDGENGGWFRNVSENSNFWNSFYIPLVASVGRGALDIHPIFIHQYLDRFGVHGEVKVRTGAWNTGWHNGVGFSQWTGSVAQRQGLERVAITSRAFHALQKEYERRHWSTDALEPALWPLLRAETSCNFYWGEAWTSRAHADLDTAWHHMNQFQASLGDHG